jgi:hypothetical protein
MWAKSENGISYMYYFSEIYENLCKGQNECEIDPSLFRLNETISQSCLDRILKKEISNEYIVVVGCLKLHINIPMTSIHLRKEQVAVYIAVMNGFAMLIISYFFYKIE